jgi:hypothetical protein
MYSGRNSCFTPHAGDLDVIDTVHDTVDVQEQQLSAHGILSVKERRNTQRRADAPVIECRTDVDKLLRRRLTGSTGIHP